MNLDMKVEKHAFPLKAPFVITGYTFTASETVRVVLEQDGFVGRGEANGVYYKNESVASMVNQLEAIKHNLTPTLTHDMIQTMLPSGGARNALDCALWDLNAKKSGRGIWGLLNIKPKSLVTVSTIGIGTPEEMAKVARKFPTYRHLKVKLDRDNPIGRLEAIHAARPDAGLIVDVNQGWSFEELLEYAPAAKKLGVVMLEQPLPRGGDEQLEGFVSPIPLGADESCLDTSEYEAAARRYDVINIKLDKCGGLTEGLKLVELARRDGKGLMVGNMTGSSLSMAPSYIIGQYCQYIDIDGPLLIKHDVDHALDYDATGQVSIPSSALWG